MLRNALIACLIATASLSVSAPAFAADAAAAATGYTTADTPIGTLLDDPAAKAVLDKIKPATLTPRPSTTSMAPSFTPWST